jgi:hypothetical protein
MTSRTCTLCDIDKPVQSFDKARNEAGKLYIKKVCKDCEYFRELLTGYRTEELLIKLIREASRCRWNYKMTRTGGY